MSLSPKKWDYIPFDKDKLTTGTAIYLSKMGDLVHAAIYLGNNQYLCLFGYGGSILVANLQEKQTLFDADHVQILEPKNQG